jgi:hypothetical protein
MAVGSAYVLVMDEELIEASEPAHPSDPEESRRRSRSECRDEPGEVFARQRSSSSFGHAPPRARQDKPGTREVVTLAQDKVGREIAGCPRRQKCRRVRTEFVEQIAELGSFDGVEERVGHMAGL